MTIYYGKIRLIDIEFNKYNEFKCFFSSHRRGVFLLAAKLPVCIQERTTAVVIDGQSWLVTAGYQGKFGE
jgi:hypothetical protein